MENLNELSFKSLDEFLQNLFENDLNNSKKFDAEVVRKINENLCSGSIHTKAGNRLAEDLIQLAKKRSQEASK